MKNCSPNNCTCKFCVIYKRTLNQAYPEEGAFINLAWAEIEMEEEYTKKYWDTVFIGETVKYILEKQNIKKWIDENCQSRYDVTGIMTLPNSIKWMARFYYENDEHLTNNAKNDAVHFKMVWG